MSDDITFERRKPGRRKMPDHIARRKINAVIVNGELVDVFDVCCYLEGRKPYQLVHDLVFAYCQEKRDDPAVAELVTALRKRRAESASPLVGLRLIKGGKK